MTTLDHDILILGQRGMLGHMVKNYLCEFYKISAISERWPSQKFKNSIKNSKSAFLINCIGAIPQRTKEFSVNYELPIWLDNNFKGKIIHPGTDCEMDNDEYGYSKKIAADWIIENGKRTKMIKSSIIGPELSGSSSFLEWFLSNSDHSSVSGYNNHMWNGVTTYYWAKFSKNLIENWNNYDSKTTIGTKCTSKYELCKILNKVYDRNINITKFNTDTESNKCLDVDVSLIDIDEQLKEMKIFLSAIEEKHGN